MFAHSEVH